MGLIPIFRVLPDPGVFFHRLLRFACLRFIDGVIYGQTNFDVLSVVFVGFVHRATSCFKVVQWTFCTAHEEREYDRGSFVFHLFLSLSDRFSLF